MYDDLTQEAITSALVGDWEKAISINLKLLKLNPGDISTLNRTARAHVENGDLAKAKQYAKKVLTIDPDNRIAKNSLRRWEHLETMERGEKKTMVQDFFIEEPGKTKVVSLVKLGEGGLIAKLDNGELVQLEIHQHKTCVCTLDGKYIGALPDNIVAKMFNQKSDGRFQVCIRSVDPRDVKVFIRRTS